MEKITVKQMLEDLMYEIEIGALRHSQEFVRSLNIQFIAKKSLSEKQEVALRKIYNDHIGGA